MLLNMQIRLIEIGARRTLWKDASAVMRRQKGREEPLRRYKDILAGLAEN